MLIRFELRKNTMPNNSAFIDSQNLNLATQNLGWNLDWAKFRVFLHDNFGVETAYLFIGYMPEHQDIYSSLQKAGYIVIFKPVTVNRDGDVKGNVDADLVLQVMIDINKYDRAVIVTGDGDFASMVSHLLAKDKLENVIIPNQRQHSALLRQSAKDKVSYLNELRSQLQYHSHRRPPARSDVTAKPEATKPTIAKSSGPSAPVTPSAAAPVAPSSARPASPSATPAAPKPTPATNRPASRAPRGRRNNAEDSLMKTLEQQHKPGEPSA
jgi:uncharacterized LabA/DUF88 family protein